MRTIELQRGEQIKVIGQKSVCMILVNVDGEIYSKTDSNREKDAEDPKCKENAPNNSQQNTKSISGVEIMSQDMNGTKSVDTNNQDEIISQPSDFKRKHKEEIDKDYDK